ncbi:MAG: TonB family protein [Alphaproteobacteria bacterium]
MAQTLGLRATSFGASTLLIAGLVFAALSVTTQVALRTPPDIGPPPISIEHPPPPPPPPVTEHTTPKPFIQTTPTITDDVQRLTPIETLPPTPTDIAVGQGPVEITSPRWTRRPSGLDRYYPPRALARGMEGEATLDCIVRITGALDCAIVSETPQGWGFGEAALRISRDYAMVPAMRDGVAVEGRYRMRAPFDIH